MDPKISAIAGLILAQTDWKWEKCLQLAYDVQAINNGLDRASKDPVRRAVVRRNENEDSVEEDVRFVNENVGREQPLTNPQQSEKNRNASG